MNFEFVYPLVAFAIYVTVVLGVGVLLEYNDNLDEYRVSTSKK